MHDRQAGYYRALAASDQAADAAPFADFILESLLAALLAAPATDQASDQVCDGERGDAQSPLQARAAFLGNWDWELVILLNQRAWQRGHAQHGFNSETHEACRRQWDGRHGEVISLAEALAFLRRMHDDPISHLSPLWGPASLSIATNMISAKLANTRHVLMRAARDHGEKSAERGRRTSTSWVAPFTGGAD